MATMTAQHSNAPSGNFKVVSLFAILVLFAASMVYAYHPEIKHGDDATAVRKCMEEKGPLETWFNPSTGREAHICKLDNGLFGIQVTSEKFHEITSFVKNKMHRLDQVRQYLSNTGYIPLQ